ncbi:MAG: Fur family transcriptional regulator [Syntrophobacteraceae bacterium]
MQDTPSRFDSMLQKLRERGYRITPQRLAILKILAESNGHPGAEDVYGLVKTDFPTTTIATVYKTLAVLKSLGEVLELEFSSDYNRYDGKKPGPHPHLICIKCKRIVDPDLESLTEMTAKLASQTGYKLISHRLDFYGICTECQQKG